MGNRELILVGVSDYAEVVADAATAAGWTVLGYCAPATRGNLPRLGDTAALGQLLADHPQASAILAVDGADANRRQLVADAGLPEERWATVIHPSAVCSSTATIAAGACIGPRAVVQSMARLGRHTIVSSASIVEHHTVLGDFTQLAANVVTGGNCSIGDGSVIGLGSKLRDQVRVGSGCTVGAGSVVVTDISDGLSVAGAPAAVVRPQRGLDLARLCVTADTSLIDAVRVITNEGAMIALVLDDEKRLAGVITDGDIRRALLANRQFDAPVSEIMTHRFMAAREDLPRAKAVDLMKAHHISHLPVLDDDGRVRGLHTLAGWLAAARLDVAAVIMAGGKGTRLLPLTKTIPKPMVRVAGRPILEHLVLHLAGSGVKEIFLAINHLGHLIEEYFGDGRDFGVNIRYLRETTPLGTGGPLNLLPRPWPEDRPVLVLNGDLITQLDVTGMVDIHQTAGNLITVGVRDFAIEIPYGVIEVDGQHISRLAEKPTHHHLVNAGIYVLSPAVLTRVPGDREFPITELIEECLGNHEPVGVHMIDGDWIDVGQHQDLSRARGMP